MIPAALISRSTWPGPAGVTVTRPATLPRPGTACAASAAMATHNIAGKSRRPIHNRTTAICERTLFVELSVFILCLLFLLFFLFAELRLSQRKLLVAGVSPAVRLASTPPGQRNFLHVHNVFQPARRSRYTATRSTASKSKNAP